MTILTKLTKTQLDTIGMHTTHNQRIKISVLQLLQLLQLFFGG